MAFDAFLKINTIEGESMDKGHPNILQVSSFSWGISNQATPTTGSGMGSGKASFGDFSFTITSSKATPKLFGAVASGQHIDKAWLYLRKSGSGGQDTTGKDFIIYSFAELVLTSYQVGGSGGEDAPTESVSFAYSAVEVAFAPQKQDGTLDSLLKKGWSVKTNAAFTA